jgi:predicted MPP superfamily phosphohydrolase
MGSGETLGQRLGRSYAKRRIEIETANETYHSSSGIELFGVYFSDATIRRVLKLTGLYRRGCRNAQEIQVKHNVINAPIPQAFDGFTILQLSDLHIDMNPSIIARLESILPSITYDLCVMTGDYRGKSSGPFEAALAGMAQIRACLKEPIYGVLGDHDTIRMVPRLEMMGIRMLLNESVGIKRGTHLIHLAGIDDDHYFHVADIAKAASEIPAGAFSILLSHTPKVYGEAAHARFNLLLSGHTHGGQICLPGGIALTLEARLPRYMGAGPWKYERMLGYTSQGTGSSIVPVRFNCPPEITLHHLQSCRAAS